MLWIFRETSIVYKRATLKIYSFCVMINVFFSSNRKEINISYKKSVRLFDQILCVTRSVRTTRFIVLALPWIILPTPQSCVAAIQLKRNNCRCSSILPFSFLQFILHLKHTQMRLHRIADHVESLDTSTKVRGMFDGMRVSPTKTEVNGANLNATEQNPILPP